MSQTLKDTILGSVKIAANASKSRASLEDFLLSMFSNKTGLRDFLDFIGIAPSEFEKHLNDLNKIGSIDGRTNAQQAGHALGQNGDIEKLLGNLAENLFSGLGGMQQ